MTRTFTFDALRPLIRDAAREWFSALRRNHLDEQFYAFALYTNDDGLSICHSANTEEGFRRKLDDAQRRGDPKGPAGIAHIRWHSSEWAYEDGRTGYPPLDRFDIEELRRLETQEDDHFSGWLFRLQMCRTMTWALGDLDREGFFGTGDERLGVTLFVTISDSQDALRVESTSAYQLNLDAVSSAFLGDLSIR